MDEDENLSNADISIEDEEVAERTREAMQQDDNEDEEDADASDVDLSSVYVLPHSNVPIAVVGTSINATPRNTGGGAGSGASAVAAAAAVAGASMATSATSNSHSPFHDWDSSVAAATPPPPPPRATSAAAAASTAGSGTGSGSGATGGDAGAKASFFFGASSFSLRSRKEVAALINTECCRGGPTPDLDSIMDTLFNPGTAIDNPDNIEWIRWLIAGGRTPQEFVKIGKQKNHQNRIEFEFEFHFFAMRFIDICCISIATS